MLAAPLHNDDGRICLLLVLEPGNLEKLKSGQPIHKWLNEFVPELPAKIELMLTYSPDLEWVAQQAADQIKTAECDGPTLLQIIQESLTREPVLVRNRSAEEMRKFV
jgi:hypothetical protein